MSEVLSLAAARRIALAAQGFGRRDAASGERAVARTVGDTGLLQIDSVNVLARAHYLPVFSRSGPYDMSALERAAWGPRRSLVEYWAHEASLIPLSTWPLLRWRMERARRGEGIYGRLARFGRERADRIAAVRREVEMRGPLTAGELSDGGRSAGGWWGWSEGKVALEWLFWAGVVTTHTRRGFERVYDLTERVLPPALTEAPSPPSEQAHRALLLIAARAQGVATERDLRDYWRLDVAETRAALAALADAGELVPVQVKGWRDKAYLHPGARRPRRVGGAALLAPFDPLVWFRPRAERLFDFRYRLEIYTPAARRVHGYYVLPFLLGERLVARVDLKAQRQEGVLQVHAVHLEPHAAAAEVMPPLAEQLARMAAWLRLERVGFSGRRPPHPDLAARLDS